MRALAATLLLAFTAPAGILADSANAEQANTVPIVAPLRRSLEREAGRMVRQAPGVVTAQGPQRSWAGRHPVALGMLIGLGGGIAWGSAQYYEGERPFGPFVALGGGIGVGIGAGVGAIVSAVKR